jgi:hypothetical protein
LAKFSSFKIFFQYLATSISKNTNFFATLRKKNQSPFGEISPQKEHRASTQVVIFLVANFRHFAKKKFQSKYSVANSFLVSGKKNCQKNEKKKKNKQKKKSTKIHHNCLQPAFFFLWRNFATWRIFFPENEKKTETHTQFICL